MRRKLLGVNEAARRFGVPKSTIRSRTKMNPRNVVRSGPQSILTSEEEDEIQKWIFDMQRRGFPVTQEMLMGTVQQILIAQPRKNPFKNNCPGLFTFSISVFKTKIDPLFMFCFTRSTNREKMVQTFPAAPP